jgi:hypothetical protein
MSALENGWTQEIARLQKRERELGAYLFLSQMALRERDQKIARQDAEIEALKKEVRT